LIIIGNILTFVGAIACVIGEIMMLKIALRLGPGWFIACLLLAPLTWLLLLALHFKQTAKPFAVAVIGLIAAGVGCVMSGLDFG
jgi:hypothetical protein